MSSQAPSESRHGSGKQQTISSFFCSPTQPSSSASVMATPTRNKRPALQPIRRFFTQISQNPKTRSLSMRCNICAEKNLSCKPLSGKPYDNFNKHLKNHHPEQYKEMEDEKKANELSGTNSTSEAPDQTLDDVVIKTKRDVFSNRMKYFKGHPKQVEFEENLLDFVTEVGPLNVVDKGSFVKLCRGLDKNIWIPSRRTIGRMLLEACKTKVKESVIKQLTPLGPQELQISTDIWSAPGHFSVIGFRAQFIGNDWKLHNILLGFKHFPDEHTGPNIRKKFQEIVFQEGKAKPEQLGVITADNASNILCAFKNSEYDLTLQHLMSQEETEIGNLLEIVLEDEEEDLDEDETEAPMVLEEDERESDMWIDEPDMAQELTATLDDIISQKEEPDPDVLLMMAEFSSTRLPCMAHLLQLAVKDAIQSNPLVKEIKKKLSRTIKFFNKSTFWYRKLKLKYPSLVKPCTTRWNSLYHCLKRILEREGYVGAINEILSQARKKARSTKARAAIPGNFKPIDQENMIHIKDILSAMANLTDDLQSDGVTSSLIILGVLDAYEYIDSYIVSDGSIEELNFFRSKLLEAIVNRFSKDKSIEHVFDDNGKRRAIFTTNIFDNKHMILASLLDPRLKKTAFEWKLEPHWGFNNKFCDIGRAVDILQTEYDYQLIGNDEPVIEASQDPHTEAPVEQTLRQTRKRRRSMFDTVQKIRADGIARQREEIASANEVSIYLNEPQIDIKENPLEWWKKNCGRFPILAKLAKIYLSFPASSGSVERLFSIAGSIGRARRAAMTPETMESVITYLDMRRTNIPTPND